MPVKRVVKFFEELKRRNVFRVGIAYVVAAWLVIQVVETIFPAFGFGDAAVRTAVIVLAIGFPLSLILSWVYELTPEGLKLDKDIDRSGPALPRAGRKLDRAIIVALALALGYFAIDKFVIDPARDAAREERVTERARTEGFIDSFGQNSLAVLPFVNMSNDADNEYFSDGVAEEVLNLLAKIPDLRVISRSSSFSFRGKDIDIPTIAEQLNVALVLEGSVRRYGNQVRITAQLIEARSDTHLWSETYQRELVDIFAIQDEISAAIVESLRDKIDLGVEESPRTTATADTEAHDAYLRGRYLLAQREIDGAAHEFEKAIALEPDYSLAHAQLAIAYWLQGLDTKAPVHVEKAMALDPTIAEAHAAAGVLSWNGEDFQGALRHLEKAIQINPSYADAYTWMANILEFSLGRYAEAYAMRKKVVQLDPLSLPGRVNHVVTLITTGRLTEADRELEKLASLAPAEYAAHRGLRLSQGGHWAEFALGLLDALLIRPDSGRFRFALGYQLAVIGLEEEALAGREDAAPDLLRLLGKPRQAVTAAEASLAEDPVSLGNRTEVGLALASAGEFARAQPYLEESWQEYGSKIVHVGFSADHAAALTAVRRAAGQEDNVADLLAAIRDHVRRCEEAGIATSEVESPDYEDGLAGFLAGDDRRGLALIARAVEDGYFISPGEAYLQSLYEHPDFAAVREMQETRQARERERFLAIVCAGNPYAAVWQPAAGTCERFAAEDGN